MDSLVSVPAFRFPITFDSHAVGSNGTHRLLRGALCAGFLIALTASAWAAKIDSVYRSTQCDGQGVDLSPFAEDDQALNNSTPQAGSFLGDVSLPIVLNDNISLYKALQDSTVNLSALSFSGTGSIQTSQLTRFDANDQANGAFLQGSAGSSFTVFFTIAQGGKLSLSVTINATQSIPSGISPALFGGSSGSVRLSKGTAIIWSRFTDSGTITFSGDLPLQAGQYQLTVVAGGNVYTGSPLGEQFATSDASFSISGQIAETVASGGGKKRK